MATLYLIWRRLAPPSSARAQLPQMARAWLFILRREGVVPAARYGLQTVRALWHGFVAFYIIRNRALLATLRPFSYAEWIKTYEPDARELARQRAASRPAGATATGATPADARPRISFITPVYNPDPAVLTDTIESVLAQTSPAWELCLVDGGSTRAGVRAVLEQYAQQDDRIQVRLLDENRGIAGNMNVGLDMATGDYIALLDHDDLLAPNLVYAVTARLAAAPRGRPSSGAELDVVYYDEDKISEDGKTRLDPWFKPEFTPDLLFSTNLLMHATLRRSLVVELGGFDSTLDGAQDWDLAFRVAHATTRIAHIPQILYHWRQVPGSAARDAGAKPWAFDAQLNCVRTHLERLGARANGVGADAEFAALGTVRVRWPTRGARVSIIIPTKNHRELIEKCLSTLLAQTAYPNYEVIVVDNQSTDPDTLAYYAEIAQDARIQIVPFHEPFNYSRANNVGARHAQGDVLLFLNNDTEIIEAGWLDEMVGWMERPDVGVVGAKLIRPDGTLQHVGIIMGLMGHGSHVFDGGGDHQYTYFGSTDWVREVQAVTGACLMTTRELFDAVGGFDEVYTIGFSDIEYCLRVRSQGKRVIGTPFARVLHKEGSSRGFYLPPADIVRATYQFLPAIAPGDPFFNPNLSYQHRIPTLARPGSETRPARLLSILRDYGLATYAASETLDAWADVPRVPVDWPALTQARPTGEDSTPRELRRVLLFTHDLSLSGAPLVMCMFGRALQRAGYTLAVVSPLEGPLHELYAEAGVQVHIEPHALEDVRAAARYLAQDWDVVVANTILSWRVIHTAHAFGRRVIWWLHESGYGRDQVKENASIAQALNVADTLLFPAQATAQLYAPWLTRHNGSRAMTKANNGPHAMINNNVVVQPYGLDVAMLNGKLDNAVSRSADRQEKDIQCLEDTGCLGNHPITQSPAILPAQTSLAQAQRQKIKILHVGSIEPRKGQDVLVNALQRLPSEISDQFEANFVGRVLDPVFWHKVTHNAAAHPGIRFLGEVHHADTMNHLREADIFVLSSRDEVLPVTVLEAMYHGKAIVSTNVGGVCEMVRHGESGFVANSEDHAALAQYIAVLLQDAELRQRFGQAAQADFQARYQLEHFTQRLTALMQKLVQKPWQ